jgi:hypothetical protein
VTAAGWLEVVIEATADLDPFFEPNVWMLHDA